MSSPDKDRGLGKTFKGKLIKMLRDSPSPPPTPSPTQDLLQSFDTLSVSGPGGNNNNSSQYTQQQAPIGFVGGFAPRPDYQHAHAVSLPPLPRPPAIPAPFANSYGGYELNGYNNNNNNNQPSQQQQSLTMQHALNPNSGLLSPNYAYPVPVPDNNPLRPQYNQGSIQRPPRPHSTSVLQPAPQSWASSTTTAADKPLPPSPQAPDKRPKPQPQQSLSAPVKKHHRASSVPPLGTSSSSIVRANSNTGPTTTVQCAGITKKASKRCTRQVKVPLSLLTDHSLSSDPSLTPNNSSANTSNGTTDYFCHQHQKELLGPSGFYARSNGTWIDFDDWIPGYLSRETQVALRMEMERAKSAGDVKGFVYAFEIRDPKTPKIVKLKVGRAVNLIRRMDQWGKQCASKEQVLRGWYPGGVDDDDGDGSDPSLMRGRIRPGPPGPWCHRLERLVHLELGELALRAAYLVPGWPNVKYEEDVATYDFKAAGYDLKDGVELEVCADCGQTHKEIFQFVRARKGRYRGHEWDLVVQPVIEKWGAFVGAFV